MQIVDNTSHIQTRREGTPLTDPVVKYEGMSHPIEGVLEVVGGEIIATSGYTILKRESCINTIRGDNAVNKVQQINRSWCY